MLDEKIILAFFIKIDKISDFISFVVKKHGVRKEEIYVYSVKGNDEEYLITFKFNKYKKFGDYNGVTKPIHIHVKNSCLFSINALNRYIELSNEIDKGNIDYRQFQINWISLKDKLLLIRNNELNIVTLYKMKDLSKYFINKDIYIEKDGNVKSNRKKNINQF